MDPRSYLLSIDQGTTSSRAIVFSDKGEALGSAQKEYPQYYPHDGWVEQDAITIWEDTLAICRSVMERSGIKPNQVAGIGITNQRETLVVWSRKTGKPVYRAIVWQDRRTAEYCQTLKTKVDEKHIHRKTGLLLDPYFSATKLVWILDHVPGARAAAENGELAAGTIDSFLLWHLTGGKVHATDATNASRTLLFNIAKQVWDEELLSLFEIPASLLPEVHDTVHHWGETDAVLLGAPIPIFALVGDQQAALVGQACFKPGMWKATYGTGCFVVLNTGNQQIESRNRLIATVGYRIKHKTTYALEGSIFTAGSAIKWLRDKMGLIRHASETEALAASLPHTGGVYVVPAFTGLGAPYWEPNARAAIVGMTFDTGRAHIVRATLEAIAYQTRDLLEAFQGDLQESGAVLTASTLRVDGGMVANDWFCQFLADMLNVSVERPQIIETTALGAAYLAGLGAGVFKSLDDIAAAWKCAKRFEPQMKTQEREMLYSGWKNAVERITRHGA